MWLVVKGIKSPNGVRGYRIAEGDVLKLGRGKFRVKEISCHGTFDGNNLEELISDNADFDEAEDSENDDSLSE